MAKIDAAYNYLLTTYGKPEGSRYDSHKKSELRNIYNSIVKINKDSPLYKIAQDGDMTKLVLDIKQNAKNIQNVVSSLSIDENNSESAFYKKVAMSSDDNVSVTYVGDDSSSKTDSFEIDVKSLAKPQINVGTYLQPTARNFEAGSYSFDLDTPTNSYEFQFNVSSTDTNIDVQQKIVRLMNQADIGLTADLDSANGKYAVCITSKNTGLAPGEDYLFSITSGKSWNEVKTLGIEQVSQKASNSVFLLNGTEHNSLTNEFTINKEFAIKLHDATTNGTPAKIGFKADTDTVYDNVKALTASYNGMVAIGHKYASKNNNLLLNDITSIGKTLDDKLQKIGIQSDENGMLSIDKDVLSEAISGNDAQDSFDTLNSLKNALAAKADKASLNPINYVNKVIVEYKNPGKTFSAPYATSAYSGMLVDQLL